MRCAFRYPVLRSVKYGPESGLRILTFHGVDERNCTDYNTRFISNEKLDKLLALIRRDARLLSLEGLFAGPLKTDRMNVVLTFDDGYRNNLTRALPVLEKYNAPACFFVSVPRSQGKEILLNDLYDLGCDSLPSVIRAGKYSFRRNFRGQHTEEGGMSFKQYIRSCNTEALHGLYGMMEALKILPAGKEDYWQLLSDREISELSAHPLITIGSHGCMHLSYPDAGREEALNDMKAARIRLSELCGKEINALAHPYECVTEQSFGWAEQAGYTLQMAGMTDAASFSDQFRIFGRMMMHPYLPPAELWACIKRGSYGNPF